MMSSLDLLLPIPSLPAFPPEPGPLAQVLEAYSVAIIQNFDLRDHPAYAHLSPTLRSEFPGDGLGRPLQHATLHTRDQFVDYRAAFLERHPGIMLHVLDTVCQLNERRGRATVWLTGQMSRYEIPDMRPREAVTILDWQKPKREDWICVKVEVTHGYFA